MNNKLKIFVDECIAEPAKPKSTRKAYEKFYNIQLKGNDFEAGYDVGWEDAMIAILDFMEIDDENS